MDIQHYIITKKEKDLRFLENKKKRERKMLPFFCVRIKKKDILEYSKMSLVSDHNRSIKVYA